MAQPLDNIPRTPTAEEPEHMAHSSGTRIQPLPWVDSPPDNRPAYIAPKPHLSARPSLQPRDAKISRDHALLDLALFLQDNPNPVASRFETNQSPSGLSPRDKFVNRVFKASTLRAPRAAPLGVVKTPYQSRVKPIHAWSNAVRMDRQYHNGAAANKTMRSESDAANEAFGTVSQPSAMSPSPKHALATTLLDLSPQRTNSVNTRASLQSDEDHRNFVSWLKREIEGQQQHGSPVKSTTTNPTVQIDSAERDVSLQQSHEKPTASRRRVPSPLKIPPLERQASSSDYPSDIDNRPIQSVQSRNDASPGFPKRRTALSSHPPGPISPPPQIPLPPSPILSSRADSYRPKSEPKNAWTNESRGVLSNNASEFRQHVTGKDVAKNGVVSKSPLSNTTIDTFDLPTDTGLVIPAKHNIGVQWSAKEPKHVSSGIQEPSIPLSSVHAHSTKRVEADQYAGSSAALDTSPARTTISTTSSGAHSLQQKAREDRTRARKLKHMHDNKVEAVSSAKVEPEISSAPIAASLDISKVGKSDIETLPETKAAFLEDLTQATEQDKLRVGSSSATDVAGVTPKAIEEQVSTANQELHQLPSKKQPHRPPCLDLSSNKSRSKFKSHSALSPAATTPAIKSPHTPRDITSALAGRATASPLYLLSPVEFKHNSSKPLSPSILSPVPGTDSIDNPSTQPCLHQHQTQNTSPMPLSHLSQAKLKTKTNTSQLKSRVSYLERENKLLEAALMAVLRTGGALNRCACPCYCDLRTTVDDTSVQSPGAENAGTFGSGAVDIEQQNYQRQESDSGVEMGADAASPSTMTADGGMVEREMDREERWSYGTSVSGSRRDSAAGSRSSGGSALALYMQTRRASGFGWTMATGAATATNVKMA